MKATGIVRRVDELGRVVLPIELRRNMHIAEKDALEIYVDDSNITVNLSEGVKAVIVPKFGFIKEILYNGEMLDFS
jgi:AbrB family looped-hinge helix DNA binding protein